MSHSLKYQSAYPPDFTSFKGTVALQVQELNFKCVYCWFVISECTHHVLDVM